MPAPFNIFYPFTEWPIQSDFHFSFIKTSVTTTTKMFERTRKTHHQLNDKRILFDTMFQPAYLDN